jgi:hypothetical protein
MKVLNDEKALAERIMKNSQANSLCNAEAPA